MPIIKKAFYIFSFVDEKFGEAVFKLTDCHRNVEDSAIPSDKEDLICICPEKKCYINFTSQSVQDKERTKTSVCNVFLSS